MITEAMKPAPSPARYQPSDCPTMPAVKEPATPKNGGKKAHAFLARVQEFGNDANDETQHDGPDDAHGSDPFREMSRHLSGAGKRVGGLFGKEMFAWLSV